MKTRDQLALSGSESYYGSALKERRKEIFLTSKSHARDKTGALAHLQETLQFYLVDCKTALGKIIDIFIILLNLFICAILVAETYPVSEETRHLLWIMDLVIVFFFIVEYAARLYGAKNRLKQLTDIYSITTGTTPTASPAVTLYIRRMNET